MKLARFALTVALLAASVAVSLLAGCNTVRGVGQDMQGIGNYIAGAAEDTNPYGP